VNEKRSRRASSRELVDELRTYFQELASQGGPKPSEKELSERFGAGKSATRDALIRLEVQGLIRRRQGARLDLNTFALLNGDSYHFGGKVIDVLVPGAADVVTHENRPVLLDARTAKRLAAEEHMPAIRLVKVVTESGVPIALSRSVIRVHSLPVADFDETLAPRVIASQLLGEETVWLNITPTAINIDAEDATLLDIKPGTAVIVYDVIGLGADGQPLYLLELTSVPQRRGWAFVCTVQ